MSTIECTDEPLNLRESVTTISANARVDYILRFSMHAVLVIDDNTETYTRVGNEFLGSLSKNHNAAFVSLSSKLNDIQIRCRIIEQLFGNTLFDPEQPLSVNVVKLAETKNEAITVVISNAEHLSIQLAHELCQLAEIAKKLNKTINVLLLGKTQAAKNLSSNKHLFDNKVSIVLASSGQLLSWNSSYLKDKPNYLIKWAMLIFVILIICGASLFIISSGYFTSNFQNDEKNKVTEEKLDEDEIEAFVKIDVSPTLEQKVLIKDDFSTIETAEPVDIYMALTTLVQENTLTQGDKSVEPTAKEIIQTEKVKEPELVTKIVEVDTVNTEALQSQPEVISSKIHDTDGKYYQSYFEGYVIQLANFTKESGYNTFINSHTAAVLYGYARKINGSNSFVVTTQVYKTMPEAKNAIKDLPSELQARNPWVKTIQAVNNEINLYKQSQ